VHSLLTVKRYQNEYISYEENSIDDSKPTNLELTVVFVLESNRSHLKNEKCD